MANDPYKYFRIEARDLLEQLSRGLIDLEKDAQPVALMSKLFRLAHTLKGAARVVKHQKIADAAHALEDLLAPYRDGQNAIPRAQIDAALALLDRAGAELSLLNAPPPPSGAATTTAANGARTATSAAPATTAAAATAAATTAVAATAAATTAAATTAAATTAAATTAVAATAAATIAAATTAAAAIEDVFAATGSLAPDPEDIDALLDGVTEAHSSLATMRQKLEVIARVRRRAGMLTELLRSPRAPSLAPAVDAAEVWTMIGEVERELEQGVARVDRELMEVRELAERLRLIPARLLFHTLERAVHDAARMLGKEATFEASGGDVRLEGAVLAAVQRALLQLVKNAIAHGIESPVERGTTAKSPIGRVRLEISRSGHRIAFSCSDDGRGFDLNAVRRALGKKGNNHDEPATLGDEQLFRALLQGGVSTSPSLTAIAGRGVGLDVVREVVEGLGGEVQFTSHRGGGAKVTIVVPTSLSSLDALLVEAGRRRAAIPLDAVKRTMRLAVREITRTAAGESIVYEGGTIPFAPLSRSLRTAETTERGAHVSLVVVESEGKLAAVGIDRLLGTGNIVSKALPELAYADPIVASAWIDAEGDPQVVLDARVLVASTERAGAQEKAGAEERTAILVIDDSMTTRMLEQSILESAGYEVELATSGEDGLEKAAQRRYALFLVDVEMPGMDGFTFIEHTQRDPELKSTPAILVTSRNAPEDLRRGEQAGARGYMVKSEFDQNELLGRIRRLIG